MPTQPKLLAVMIAIPPTCACRPRERDLGARGMMSRTNLSSAPAARPDGRRGNRRREPAAVEQRDRKRVAERVLHQDDVVGARLCGQASAPVVRRPRRPRAAALLGDRRDGDEPDAEAARIVGEA